jgi:4-amino-4-deoxy-L-arabinose transferase-like glycosyltransferase
MSAERHTIPVKAGSWADLIAGWRGWVILAVVFLVAVLPGVVSLPPLDRDESRFSQATAQMLETDDYVTIRYQDELRNRKPIGIYWLQAGAAELTGQAETRAIWAWRLPSVVAGLLAVWAVFWAGQALMPRAAAWLGAALMAPGLLLTTEAHIAKTDATLALTVILAMGCLAWLRTRNSYVRRFEPLALGFWAAVGAGTLIKGPITVMVAGLALVTLWVWDAGAGRGRNGRAWFAPLGHWSGPVLFLAMVLPWLIAIQLSTGGAFLRDAIGGELSPKITGGGEHGTRPPGLHLLIMPLMFFPASFALIAGLNLAARTLRQARGEVGTDVAASVRFLLAWAVPSWLVWELATTKLVHYTLPSQPALALLGGLALAACLARPVAERTRWWGGAVVLALGGLALAWVASPLGMGLAYEQAAASWAEAYQKLFGQAPAPGVGPPAPNTPMWPGLVVVGLVLLASLGLILRRQGVALVLALTAGVVLGVGLRVAVLPAQGWMLPTPTVVAELKAACAVAASGCEVPPARFVRVFGYNEPSLVFSLGTDTAIQPAATADLPPVGVEARPVWVFNRLNPDARVAEPALREAAALQGRCVTERAPFAAHNYSNGRPLWFAVVVVEPGPCPAS